MNMKPLSLIERLDLLSQNGVEVVDPRQTFVDETVRLDRIFPGSVLFPGTRLSGPNTAVAPGAKIGTEGPATVANAVIGENAEVASGYVTGSVLLTNARIGSNAHLRSGTLLEEETSTAHAVGLKQTVLMSFVTLGSLINCCDCLISGGRSRSNHTEVGSGFIHFNFTPWGDGGDKATPSLIGGVPQGVFLRQERIFIGGLSGIVGPHRVGFGSVTVAGQVIRSDVAANRIYSEPPRRIDAPWDFQARRPSDRLERNLEYIGHLVALRSWYFSVRKRRLPHEDVSSHQSMAIDAAIELLDGSIVERWTRLAQFVGHDLPSPKLPAVPCPLSVEQSSAPYVNWIQDLPDDQVQIGVKWLQQVIEAFAKTNAIQTPDLRTR